MHRFDAYSSNSYSRGIRWLPSPEVCRMGRCPGLPLSVHPPYPSPHPRFEEEGVILIYLYPSIPPTVLNLCPSVTNRFRRTCLNNHSSYPLNPFPNKPWFLRVCSTSLLKTLWEKEKLLVTSNFSFSHIVFYPFRKLSAIYIIFEIVVWKVFQFVRV